MVTRTLAAYYRYAQLMSPGLKANAEVDARDPAAEPAWFQAAVEGHVLVKKVNNALPLKAPKKLSLFGCDAVGGQNTTPTAPFLTSYCLQNAQTYNNGQVFTDLDLELFFAEAWPASHTGPQAALNGTLIPRGGSGTTNPPYIISPYDAFEGQAAKDGTALLTDFTSIDPAVDESSDASVVFINELASEPGDRSTLADEYADMLILNVARQCNNTMVIIHNAGVRLVDRWIEHPNVTAVIYAHLPGQHSGDALVEIMYGCQSPSGRLPFSVPKTESDYGPLLNPTLPDSQSPFYSQSDFTERCLIDYK